VTNLRCGGIVKNKKLILLKLLCLCQFLWHIPLVSSALFVIFILSVYVNVLGLTTQLLILFE